MTRTKGRRRIASAAALAVVAAIITPQLLERDPVVTVLGPRTGEEEQRFRELMEAEGIRIRYQGTSAQREVLLSRVQAGDPPDIAIMPRCLDASDVMRPAVRDAFHEAVLRTVAAVAGRGLSDVNLDDILEGVQNVQNVQDLTDKGEGVAGLQVCSEAGA